MSAVADAKSRLKFEVEWHMRNGENVGLVFAVTEGRPKIAELYWNGAEWLFVPIGKDGETHTQGGFIRYIDVDPQTRLHLNLVAEENAKDRLDRHETVQAALDAALATRRRQFRDDTRELAELGARMYARWWYPQWREL